MQKKGESDKNGFIGTKHFHGIHQFFCLPFKLEKVIHYFFLFRTQKNLTQFSSTKNRYHSRGFAGLSSSCNWDSNLTVVSFGRDLPNVVDWNT